MRYMSQVEYYVLMVISETKRLLYDSILYLPGSMI